MCASHNYFTPCCKNTLVLYKMSLLIWYRINFIKPVAHDRPTLEKLIVNHLVKKFLCFRWTRRFIIGFTIFRHGNVSLTGSDLSRCLYPICLSSHFNNILPFNSRTLTYVDFYVGLFWSKFCMFLSLRLLCVTCLCDHIIINLVIVKLQVKQEQNLISKEVCYSFSILEIPYNNDIPFSPKRRRLWKCLYLQMSVAANNEV